jgi:hypothetical protein
VRVRLIGYWCEDRSPESDRWPDPRDLIDESWSNQERELVARYFERGFKPWAFMGLSGCRLCGQVNGSAEFTDGVYLWPEGLAHYVREHSVKLPDEVLSHVRRRYEEMEPLDVDWSAEYKDRVFWPEGAAEYIREHAAELPDEALAHVRGQTDEVETLVVDRDWWPKVTSS